MKTKIYLIIIAAFLLSSRLYSQQNDFVRLDGKRFMLGCDEFYPKVMNFSFGVNDTLGEKYITPYFSFRNAPICNTPYSKTVSRNQLKAQMQMIKDLGFNTIRIGLEVFVDKNSTTTANILMIHYAAPCGKNYNEPLIPKNYSHIFQILDQVMVIAGEVGLKVINLTSGGNGLMETDPIHIEQYRDYLAASAIHFANQPVLMAYDLYNEPHYASKLTDKREIYNATKSWYEAIRSNSPNQLVTIGLGDPYCITSWDQGIMYLDFVSIHYYPQMELLHPDLEFKDTAPFFKWMGENVSKPWIIGETGEPSDSVTHPFFNILYQNTTNYANYIKEINAINGSSGFSWWNYQDVCFYNPNENLALGNYFGLMNKRDETGPLPHHTTTSDTSLPPVDGIMKLPNNIFSSYNPIYTPPSSPIPQNYYNIWNYNTNNYSNTVYGPNGPLKDAMIIGWKLITTTINETPKSLYPCYSTFSRPDGTFDLKTGHPEIENLCGLYITATGMNIIQLWDDHGLNSQNFPTNPTLQSLNLNTTNNETNQFNDYIIKSGQTIEWNNPAMMAGNLIIKNGGQLTVKGSVFFNTNKKVMVEPGGKLIVDGGILTSGCENGSWVGVEVQGNPNQAQTEQYQGYVLIKNNATIENAVIGVHCVLNAYMPADNGGGIPYASYASGGIVIANNSTFRNNKTAINIEHYFPITYYSGINVCRFENTTTLDPNTDVENTDIKLTGVRNVNIFGNTFEGNTNNDFQHRGIGIEAHDATFRLNGNWNPPLPNSFLNKSYGIACYNTSSLANPEISLTNFTDCWRAIYLSGVTQAKVLANTISYKSQSTVSGEQAYGIYLDNCTGYHVEGNKLSSSSTNMSEYPENGIVINNSGADYNRIYRNSFTKIQTPINAQNVNRNTGGSLGLELLCNNIIECTTNDIVVTYEPGNTNTNRGIKMDQGDYTNTPKIPAANLFTKGGKVYKNYTNTSPNVVHYAHYQQNDIIYYESKPHYVMPRVTSTVSNHNTQINWDSTRWVSTDCPNNTGFQSGKGKSIENIEGLKVQINLLQPKIDSLNLVLNQKMDNGNTQQLINIINTCGATGYQLLYNNLRTYSPYLSEEVLLAIIHKQGFPTNMLLNLMLVNTHVAKTYWLMDELLLVQPPLSNGQLKQIQNKINVFSAMEIDRSKLSNLLVQRDNAYNLVESYYAHDSLPTANDSMGIMLQRDPRLTAKCQLVYHYLAKDDSTNADLLLDQIPQLFSLDANAQIEYNNYKQLYNLKRNLQREGKNFNNLSEEQQQLLISVINNPALSGSEMSDLNALRQVDEIVIGKMGISRGKSLAFNYEEPILDPVENKEKNLDNTEITENENLLMEGLLDKVLMEQNSLQIYPNPAGDEVNILYNVGNDISKVSIEISDITGRIIVTYPVVQSNNLIKINTQAFKEGIYYVILVVDGNRQKVEKVVIQ